MVSVLILPPAATLFAGVLDGAQEMAMDEAFEEFIRENEKLIKKGKLDEVQSVLEEAVVATNNLEIWRLLGKVYYQKGKVEEAIYCYTVVNKLKPGDSGVSQWLQAALQGRAAPQIRSVPAIVMAIHGTPSSRETQIWVRGPDDKEMKRAARTVRFHLEAGTGMLWYFVAFGVESSKAYYISWGTEWASTSDITSGEEKPFPTDQKILPPGFDPTKSTAN